MSWVESGGGGYGEGSDPSFDDATVDTLTAATVTATSSVVAPVVNSSGATLSLRTGGSPRITVTSGVVECAGLVLTGVGFEVTPTTDTPTSVANTSAYRSLYTNEGAAGQIVFTLVGAAADREYAFYVQSANNIRITAASGDTIRVGTTVTAAAGYIENATVGSYVRLVAINATEWVAIASIGTWTVGP